MKHSKMIKLATVMSATALLSACNKPAEKTEVALNLEDADSKVSYAIGVSSGKAMAGNLASLDGTGINLDKEILVKAFADGMTDTSQLDNEAIKKVMDDFRVRVNTAMQAKREQDQVGQSETAEQNLTKGAEFLALNKVKEGVVTLDSGLQYKVLTEGKGKKPGTGDRVVVHYTGTLIDGTKFDSSVDRGQPATFGVTQVIKGWTEALQLMSEGSKWQLVIPSDLAYGPTSRPQIPGNSVLLFDVELIKIAN